MQPPDDLRLHLAVVALDQQELDAFRAPHLRPGRGQTESRRKPEAEGLVRDRVVESLDRSLQDMGAGRPARGDADPIPGTDNRHLVLNSREREPDVFLGIVEQGTRRQLSHHIRQIRLIEPAHLVERGR